MKIRMHKTISLDNTEKDILRHAMIILGELNDNLEGDDEVEEIINGFHDIIHRGEWVVHEEEG